MMLTEVSQTEKDKNRYDSTYRQNLNKAKLTEIAQKGGLQGFGDKARGKREGLGGK